MYKMEPALCQYRRNKNGKVSRWINSPDARLMEEMGYEVRKLYTKRSLEIVAASVITEALERLKNSASVGHAYVAINEIYPSIIIKELTGE